MATDAERSQQNANAKAQWKQWEAMSLTPAAAISQRIEDPPRPPEIEVPSKPQPPGPPRVAEFRRRLQERVPRWALGERAIARRLAVLQAEEVAELEAKAHQRGLAGHLEDVKAAHAAIAKQEQDYEAEKRLVSGVAERARAGELDAARFLLARSLGLLPFPVEFSVDGRRAHFTVEPLTVEQVPEREATTTAAGKPTTRKLNKSERNDAVAAALADRVAGAACIAGRVLPDGMSVAVEAAANDGRVVARHVADDAKDLRSKRVETLTRAVDIARAGAAGNVVALD